MNETELRKHRCCFTGHRPESQRKRPPGWCGIIKRGMAKIGHTPFFVIFL